MRKLTIAAVTTALSIAMIPGVASADPYVLNYQGSDLVSGNPISVTLNLDVDNSGGIAKLISGQRNGMQVTDLTSYRGADNRLFFNDPFVDFTGLSYVLGDGTETNFYYTGSAYTEADGPAFLTSVTLRPASIAAPVPEPTTWALMLLGFAIIGFAIRRSASQTERVRYAF